MSVTTTDLAAWLTQIWDEQEQAARFTQELTERSHPAEEFDIEWRWGRISRHKTSGGGGSTFELGAPSPQQVLARIAADRKILELHKATDWISPSNLSCEICHEDYSWGPDAGDWPCATLKALASAYQDREGFREEWKP